MKNHILVIDDERFMCYGLKKALSDDRIEVDTVSTASEAILALSACNYDICLLDIHLSDDSGFRMMEVIRDFCPRIKIILMTASEVISEAKFKEAIGKARENGACHFLCKPFNLKHLKDVVFRLLDKDDAFAPGDWLENGFFGNTRRESKRQKWSEHIHFTISVIYGGEVQRITIPAESVDISEDGIGLITPYPLKSSQVISFDEALENRTGVVVWSESVDNERCMAGIRFA